MLQAEKAHKATYKILFSDSDFALLWVGQFFSSIADGLHLVALPWLALEISGSPSSVGVVMAGYTLAIPVFGLLGGAIADRWDRKKIMALSLSSSAVLVFLIPILSSQLALAPLSLSVLSFLLSTSSQFFEPALNAALPQMITKERLTAANSVVMSTKQVGTIIGPGLGGLIIAFTSTPFIFYFDALAFALAACAVYFCAIPWGRKDDHEDGFQQADPEPRTSLSVLLSDVRAAFAFVKSQVVLMMVIILAVLSNFAIGPIQVAAPGFVQESFGKGADGFGFLLSMLSSGMVIAMLIVGKLDQYVSKGFLILSGFTLAGLALISVKLTVSYSQLLPLFFLSGCGLAAVNVPVRTIIQASAPDHLLGKVLSLDMVLSTSAVPMSQMLFGVFAEFVNPRATFLVAGCVLLFCSVLGFVQGDIRNAR